MPKEVSEISSGQQFSRSSNEGQLADSQTRTFRILLSSTGEAVDIQSACQVRIGDQHPYNTNLYCVSFDARFEGDSRMVIGATFNYQSTADGGSGQDPKSVPPDVRPPNWTTGTSLAEKPVTNLRNPAGDIFDGIVELTPVISIGATVFEPEDPLRHNDRAGKVNKFQLKIKSLVMEPRTLMFRGVSCQPAVESWGDLLYSGWNATYEFLYKPNSTEVFIPGVLANPGIVRFEQIGWDIAVPQTGFNVITFNPAAPNADQDPYGQPLEFDDDGAVQTNPLALAQGLAVGSKARAMVRIPFSNKFSLSPSASPIPLNLDGTPRINTANPPVIVLRTQVQDESDFKTAFPRLQFP